MHAIEARSKAFKVYSQVRQPQAQNLDPVPPKRRKSGLSPTAAQAARRLQGFWSAGRATLLLNLLIAEAPI